MTEFREVDELEVSGGRIAYLYNPWIVRLGYSELTVERARALRDWLNSALPDPTPAESSK